MKKSKNEAVQSIHTYGTDRVGYLELLNAIGIPHASASALLALADNRLSVIARMSIIDIAGIKGIGIAKAAAIIAAIELGRRRQVEQAATKEMVMQSSCIYDLLHPHLRDIAQEQFWILLLDRRSRIIRYECIHQGGMASTVVDPKIVFQKALMHKASSIILCHNHPSGSPSPSMEDIRLTEKIKLAGTYLDIKVLDHVIIGDGGYHSFADNGQI